MFGLIFGSILIIAGVIAGICLSSHVEYTNDQWAYDETGKRVKEKGKAEHTLKKYSPIAYISGSVLGVLIIFFGCIANVGTGKTGVVTTFGKIENYTLDSGFHLKAPWRTVTEIDTTINELKFSTPAYTKDSQTVELEISVQYRISTTDTFNVIKDNGLKDAQTHLQDKLQNRITSTIKTIVSAKDANELLINRSGLVVELGQKLDDFSDEYYIIVASTNITNIDFTDEYESAVAAKVAQQQAYEKALIEQQQALAAAENNKKIAETNAQAEAAKAKIAADAEADVVKIQAEAAEYQGRREAAIRLQTLASVNGWTVVSVTKDVDGTMVTYNKLYKSDETPVTESELQAGAANLLISQYYAKWDGKLPTYYMNSDGTVSTVLIPEIDSGE